jgi:hypothetical protein
VVSLSFLVRLCSGQAAPTILSVEEARLAQALHEVDRPERDTTEKSHMQQAEQARLREEVRKRRFTGFGDDESDVGDEDMTCRMFTPARTEHARHIRLIHENITDIEP